MTKAAQATMPETKKPKAPAKAGSHPRSVSEEDLEVGRKIRMRRMQIKMSQEDLGNHLGVSFQQVQKYEKGVNRVGAARLNQVATALQVSVAWFYEGMGVATVSPEAKKADDDLSAFLSDNYGRRVVASFTFLKPDQKRTVVEMIESFVV